MLSHWAQSPRRLADNSRLPREFVAADRDCAAVTPSRLLSLRPISEVAQPTYGGNYPGYRVGHVPGRAI